MEIDVADERVRSDPPVKTAPVGLLVAKPTPAGGFRLEGEGGYGIEALADSDGWVVTSSSRTEEWFLREISTPYRGYTLEERRTADPLGLVSHQETAAASPGLVSLVLGDGRLFTVSPKIGDPPGHDLSGWEVPGAYWNARLEKGRWSLAPTVAGVMLSDAEAIVVLFAAHLLLP
jgi:hypothetical protein